MPYTRIIEHKHFDWVKTDITVVTHEYPEVWHRDATPYYPINNDKNNALYQKYKELVPATGIIFGGRLAEYRYYDMHQVIAAALHDSKKVLTNP